MNNYLEYFDNYVFKGLMPIAVYKGTKVPASKEWNKGWDRLFWRKFFLKESDFEIGLLWNNGMIDIETDDKKSFDYLQKLIGNIERPIYKSLRSYHNIFYTPHKNLNKTVLYINKKRIKIEVCAKNSFTLAPPSKHPNGEIRYTFLNDIWPPPPCPDAIKSLCLQKRKKSLCNKDLVETICNNCLIKNQINKIRLKREVNAFKILGMHWMCNKCKKVYNVELKIKEIIRKVKKSYISQET